MFEKVNPKHPDKIADRIAGAIVDHAYAVSENPHIACEVLVGHSICTCMIETDTHLNRNEVKHIIERISGIKRPFIRFVGQDEILNKNQEGEIRCGDNGIFKGVPINDEEKRLTKITKDLYLKYDSDGKCILNDKDLIICQSNAKASEITKMYKNALVNPLGDFTGGIDVDSGATNRKLGSDMGRAITGGGLFGKDLSKADVSVNIYAFLKAQETKKEVELYCAIGDETVDSKPFSEIVKIAKDYIKKIGGFEKFAEWGLIR